MAGACSLAALYYSNKLPSEAELWEYEKAVLRSEVSHRRPRGERGGVGWWNEKSASFCHCHGKCTTQCQQQGTGEAVGLLSEEGQREEEEEDEDEEEEQRDEEEELRSPEASLPKPKGKGPGVGKGKGKKGREVELQRLMEGKEKEKGAKGGGDEGDAALRPAMSV